MTSEQELAASSPPLCRPKPTHPVPASMNRHLRRRVQKLPGLLYVRDVPGEVLVQDGHRCEHRVVRHCEQACDCLVFEADLRCDHDDRQSGFLQHAGAPDADQGVVVEPAVHDADEGLQPGCRALLQAYGEQEGHRFPHRSHLLPLRRLPHRHRRRIRHHHRLRPLPHRSRSFHRRLQ